MCVWFVQAPCTSSRFVILTPLHLQPYRSMRLNFWPNGAIFTFHWPVRSAIDHSGSRSLILWQTILLISVSSFGRWLIFSSFNVLFSASPFRDLVTISFWTTEMLWVALECNFQAASLIWLAWQKVSPRQAIGAESSMALQTRFRFSKSMSPWKTVDIAEHRLWSEVIGNKRIYVHLHESEVLVWVIGRSRLTKGSNEWSVRLWQCVFPRGWTEQTPKRGRQISGELIGCFRMETDKWNRDVVCLVRKSQIGSEGR
jgi:hypothetical protein